MFDLNSLPADEATMSEWITKVRTDPVIAGGVRLVAKLRGVPKETIDLIFNESLTPAMVMRMLTLVREIGTNDKDTLVARIKSDPELEPFLASLT